MKKHRKKHPKDIDLNLMARSIVERAIGAPLIPKSIAKPSRKPKKTRLR